MRLLPALSLLATSSIVGCKCDVDPLETPKPHMKVSPSVVALPSVPLAQDTRIIIQVQNDAIVELKTLDVELKEGSDPAFKLDPDFPTFVNPGQTGEVIITVRPLLVSTITATVILRGDGHDTAIETDDAQPAPYVEVPITVTSINAGLPDICDYPEEVELGLVGKNDVGRKEVPFKNCGVRDLIIDTVLFCPDLDEEGAVPDDDYAECAEIDTAQIRLGTEIAPGTALPPGTSASIPLLFLPIDLEEHRGDLVILSNDPDESPLLIPVAGEGAACPIAVAELVDDPEGIEPFDTVRLDASNSVASDQSDPEVPGSFSGEYEWTLRQRPQGSTAIPFPNGQVATEIETDLAGRYVVDLHVFEIKDEGRVRSCEPSTVTFDVVPTEELLIQLVWDHPSADLDLHLVRGGGTEFTHEDDCYFSNREPQQTDEHPDWSANPEENPVLDVDDDDGYGPENLNIIAPAPNSEWRVLVHYWNKLTDGDARTTATVRVFVYGQQEMEISRTFEDDEQLWEALDITWPAEEAAPAGLSQLGVVREYPRPF